MIVYGLNSVDFVFQVNKTHDSEEQMPQVSFFTGKKKSSEAGQPSNAGVTCSSASSSSGIEQKVIKSLEEFCCPKNACDRPGKVGFGINL